MYFGSDNALDASNVVCVFHNLRQKFAVIKFDKSVHVLACLELGNVDVLRNTLFQISFNFIDKIQVVGKVFKIDAVEN